MLIRFLFNFSIFLASIVSSGLYFLPSSLFLAIYFTPLLFIVFITYFSYLTLYILPMMMFFLNFCTA